MDEFINMFKERNMLCLKRFCSGIQRFPGISFWPTECCHKLEPPFVSKQMISTFDANNMKWLRIFFRAFSLSISAAPRPSVLLRLLKINFHQWSSFEKSGQSSSLKKENKSPKPKEEVTNELWWRSGTRFPFFPQEFRGRKVIPPVDTPSGLHAVALSDVCKAVNRLMEMFEQLPHRGGCRKKREKKKLWMRWKI